MFINSQVIVNTGFFWKINPNYFRSHANLTRTQIRNTSGSLPLLLLKPVQSKNIKLAKLTEDSLLICCLTMPGFSFGKKL